MLKNKNGQEIDLNKYRDPSGLSLAKINFGLWLSEKRKTISRITITVLILVSIFFFSYSIYNYILYFMHQDSSQEPAINISAPRNQVSDLLISNIQALKINGYYDFVASIENPNDRFKATFEYCFLTSEEEISCEQGFILPGEKKYLLAINKNVSRELGNVNLEIRDTSWQRIDNREIPDWQSFYKERLNLSFNNIKITPSGTSNGRNYLEFIVTNNSAYSYQQVPLNIVFYKDYQIAGVNRYVANNLMSGEKRLVRLSWSTVLAGVNNSEISPDLNILDDSIYLRYQGSERR